MAKGTEFVNGQAEVFAPSMPWMEKLTVVRRDDQSYGVTRYVVKDKSGRHGYAY